MINLSVNTDLFTRNIQLLGMVVGGSGPNINRLNGIFFALFFCVLYGIRYILITLRKWLYEKPVVEGSLKDALLKLRYPEWKLGGGD